MTGSARDLAVVSSPLQYMNVVEWRASLGEEPCDLVLIGDRHDGGGSIAALMRRKSPWSEIFRVGRRPRPPAVTPRFVKDLLDLRHRIALERLGDTLAGRGYERVAFGDYRNVSQRLLVERAAGRSAALTLVDDGSVAPQAAAFRADPARAPDPGQFRLSWFRTGLARRMFGEAPPPEPDRLTFFTIYGEVIGDGLAPSDEIAPNAYAAWKAGARPGPRGNAAWLIGANHGEAGICAPEDYRALVLEAARRLREEGRGPIVYRRHRGQSERTAADLSAAAGMTLAPSTAPVELDYLDAGERPATVAVFASSAADTLAAIDTALDVVRVALPATYLRKRADHIKAVVAAHDAFNPRLRVIETDPDLPPRERS